MKKNIKAIQAREGDTMVFSNPRFNYIIEEIAETRDGQVLFRYNNDTATEFYDTNEYITVER